MNISTTKLLEYPSSYLRAEGCESWTGWIRYLFLVDRAAEAKVYIPHRGSHRKPLVSSNNLLTFRVKVGPEV